MSKSKVTAFGQFFDAVNKEVRSQNQSVKDIRKIVSEMWKNADNATKEEYKEIAMKAKGVDPKPAKKKSDKPLSVYMQYTNEVRNKVREQNPDMKMPEISKVIGKMWKELGEEGKKPYYDRYKAQQAEAKQDAEEEPEEPKAEPNAEPKAEPEPESVEEAKPAATAAKGKPKKTAKAAKVAEPESVAEPEPESESVAEAKQDEKLPTASKAKGKK